MSTPDIVDSHCHLDFPELAGELDDVIDRANAAGVTRMVTICTRLHTVGGVRDIAERYTGVFFAAGTHPHYAAEDPIARVEDLLSLAHHPKMVGIGETGLDYFYTRESADSQKQSLRIHIEAARQSGLPLIIHSRAADEDMAEILAHEYRAGAFKCVLHCFSSGEALARVAIDLGFYLSMSGIVTFKKSDALRDIFAQVPLDRVLVETDSPYLAPTPHRGKRNEPAFTAHTAQVGAEVFGLDYDAFAGATSANFDTLFAKAASWQA